MVAMRDLWNRLRLLATRRRSELELDAELRFHLEKEIEYRIKCGADPDEARRAAYCEFGGMESSKEECRDARGTRPLEDLFRDLAYGLRTLVKSPGFAVVAVLTLALGIGATTAIFSVVDGVLLKPLPYRDPDRIVTLSQTLYREGETQDTVSPANFTDWRERSSGFLDMAAAEPYSRVYKGPEGPDRIRTWLVSTRFFEILGTPALLGRWFTSEEYTDGRDRVVILGYGVWQRQFGGRPSILGEMLTLDNEPYTVVGVMPPRFHFPPGRDIWCPKVFTETDLERRGAAYLPVVARLRPGVSLADAQARMKTIGEQLAQEYPRENKNVGIAVTPLGEQLVSDVRPALLMLLGSVQLVLLSACANMANLLLVRAARREREFAIRAALGASRSRIIRQLIAESLLLALIGCAAGIGLACWGVDAIRALIPPTLPRIDEIRVDSRTLVYAMLVSVATGVLFGLAPAIRTEGCDISNRLKSGPRQASAAVRMYGMRGILIIGEVSLALILLVGAGLLVRSFFTLMRVERGFQTDHVFTALMFVWQDYPENDQRAAFVDEFAGRIAALPGVLAAGAGSSIPLAERFGPEEAIFTIVGQPPLSPGQEPAARTTVATPGYFETLGIPLRAGRVFARADNASAVPVAVINEVMARRFWRGRDPIGSKIVMTFSGRRDIREIIGVVGATRHDGLDDDPDPALFIPHAQFPTGSIAFVARTSGDPVSLLPAVRAALREINGGIPVSRAASLEQLLDTTLKPRRFNLLLLLCFSGTALILAASGIYGVMSYVAGSRIREIGVRLALGARPSGVLSLVMRQGLAMTLCGIACGTLGALALTRVLTSMLYGITPFDLFTFLATAGIVLAAAVAACLIPAVRATRVDVLRVLRCD